MNRLVSLLLIFSLLLVQSVPHSHAGSGVVEPGDHDSRPHIHLSLHSHSHGHSHSHSHGHSHSQHRGQAHSPHDGSDNLDEHTRGGATCLYGVSDHDHDAIYLAGSTFSRHRLSANGIPTHFTSLPGSMAECFCFERTSEAEASPPPLRQRPLPIYLLVASLRL